MFDPFKVLFSLGGYKLCTGIRGDSRTILAHCPSHRSSKVIISNVLPPKSPGPRHVGAVSQILGLLFCIQLKNKIQHLKFREPPYPFVKSI